MEKTEIKEGKNKYNGNRISRVQMPGRAVAAVIP